MVGGLTGMVIEELWSKDHQARAVACAAAVASGDVAAALFAIEGASADDQAAARSALDDWGRRVAAVADDAAPRAPAPPAARGPRTAIAEASALRTVLGEELGFAGERDDYYSPRNSHLHQVIARRRGLPILLSAVWMEVGARAGIRVEGIGLPGHFIVRVGGEALVDPFGGGLALDVVDCKRIVRALGGDSPLPWNDEHLAPVSLLSLSVRVLQNLIHAAAKADDSEALFRLLSFVAALRPDTPRDLLNRAVVAESLGARAHASDAYADIVRRFPGSQEAKIAAERHRARKSDPPLN